MFTQTFIDSVQDTKKKYTVAISLFLQIAALGVLVVIPLLYTEVLPGAQLRSFLLAPTPPQPPPVPLIKEAVTATSDCCSSVLCKDLNGAAGNSENGRLD